MRRKIPWSLIVPLVSLIGALLWALWPILRSMSDRWSGDPRYAHGYLVPLFAFALLWIRRHQISLARLRPSSWGLVFLALGGAIQLVGAYFRQGFIEGFSILPYAAGVAMLLGGWPVLRWAGPSILFLFFMIPLPWRVEKASGPPLQQLATLASTYSLQTMGFMAFSEGNVIELNEARIGVVEACSGLSMFITFIALSTGMAMVIQRPLLDKIVLVLSAIPVALVANIARITLTGILHEKVGVKFADQFYHVIAGWVMIPFALFLYWCVIWVFSHILVDVEEPQVPVKLSAGRRSSSAKREVPTVRPLQPVGAMPRAKRRR
jgi:exosortase